MKGKISVRHFLPVENGEKIFYKTLYIVYIIFNMFYIVDMQAPKRLAGLLDQRMYFIYS